MSHTHYNNSRQLWTSHKSVCHSSPRGFYCCTDLLRTTIWLSASHAKKTNFEWSIERGKERRTVSFLIAFSFTRQKEETKKPPNLTHTHKHTHVARLKVSSKQNASSPISKRWVRAYICFYSPGKQIRSFTKTHVLLIS